MIQAATALPIHAVDVVRVGVVVIIPLVATETPPWSCPPLGFAKLPSARMPVAGSISWNRGAEAWWSGSSVRELGSIPRGSCPLSERT